MIEAGTLITVLISIMALMLSFGTWQIGRLSSDVAELKKRAERCESHREQLLAEKMALLTELSKRRTE